MNELSLFTGIGGGLLGTKLLGWRHIGYIESDHYRQRVIRARIDDGILDNAPIFGDIRAFIDQGYAASYTGLCDVITAGFPCQPFSPAGKKLGADDPRNMWPETIRCIRIVRPRHVLLENSARLPVSGYFDRIIADLAESGYVGRWDCIPACAVGAPHQRDRVWIVAHADPQRCPEAWPNQSQRPEERARSGRNTGRIEDGADTSQVGCDGGVQPEMAGEERSFPWPEGNHPWTDESPVARVAHGSPNWMERTSATGDAQVPPVVAAAWEMLTQ